MQLKCWKIALADGVGVQIRQPSLRSLDHLVEVRKLLRLSGWIDVEPNEEVPVGQIAVEGIPKFVMKSNLVFVARSVLHGKSLTALN